MALLTEQPLLQQLSYATAAWLILDEITACVSDWKRWLPVQYNGSSSCVSTLLSTHKDDNPIWSVVKQIFGHPSVSLQQP